MPEGLVGRPGGGERGTCGPMEEVGVLGSMGVRGNCRLPVSLEMGWALGSSAEGLPGCGWWGLCVSIRITGLQCGHGHWPFHLEPLFL